MQKVQVKYNKLPLSLRDKEREKEKERLRVWVKKITEKQISHLKHVNKLLQVKKQYRRREHLRFAEKHRKTPFLESLSS